MVADNGAVHEDSSEVRKQQFHSQQRRQIQHAFPRLGSRHQNPSRFLRQVQKQIARVLPGIQQVLAGQRVSGVRAVNV